MPVEPSIADTNVLVYALDADATQHASSRALLEAGRAASVTLDVTSQIICEFYSVVTNPRRVAKECSPAAALDAIASLFGFLRVLPAWRHTWLRNLFAWLRRRPVTVDEIYDFVDPRHHER
jgi:predicted nucleic acid-binding protein